MKIKQLHIYGFGKWQDQRWDLSEQQLSVIVGDNEAGKSTIRAFILFILFGLSPQQRQRYLPKRGGQLGGRLVVQASNGQDYTIERIENRSNAEAVCYDQNGQKQEPDWLSQELNGVDRALYNQIFNFDVFGLQLEGGFSKEQLGEVLLSVGMTGSDRIYQTEKQLNKVLDGQFKKQGSKPALNQLINQLIDQERELKSLEDSVVAYQRHLEKRETYQAEIEQKRAKMQGLNQELDVYVEQQRVYPAIENFQLVKQKLTEFPEKIDFPEQGEARFRSLKETIQPLQADFEVAKRQENDLEADRSQLEARLLSDQKIRQISAKLDHVSQYHDQLTEKNHLERQMEEKEQMIRAQLNELKLNITEVELKQLPINYTTEETWKKLADQYYQTTKQITDDQQSLDTLITRGVILKNEVAELEAKTLSTREKNVIENELEQINQRFNLRQQKDHPFMKQQLSHRVFSFLSVFLLVASLMIILVNQNNLLNGLLAGFIVLIGVTFIWQQLKFRKNWLAVLNEQSNEQTIESTERRAELVKKLALHDNNRDQLILAREKLKQIDDQQMNITEELRKLTSDLKQIERAIEHERNQFSFLANLSVGFWPDLATRLREIIDLIDQRDQLKANHSEQVILLDQFETETSTQFNDLFDREESSFQEQLMHLNEIAVEQNNLREQQEKLSQRLKEQSRIRKTIEAKMIPYQDNLSELLKLANVDSEEDFLTQAHLYREWDELKEKQAEMVRQIQLHLPETVTSKIFAGEFLSKNELETQIELIREQLEELEEWVNELVQKEAEEQAILKSLAHSKVTVDLKHAFYLTQDKLVAGARDWLVHQVALTQIEQTKAVFQTSYLPVVLEKASEFLAQLTAGRYLKLDFDQRNHQLYLLAADQQTYELDQLSQGTIDQLFVSIRLAISSWLAEHIRLPFLIDDGFVHFDRERKREMGQILAQLSVDHQMIYFTKDTDGFDQDNDRLIVL